ncbi:hypothetical protein C8R43DRAFT_1141536 [Mycena crocata]|nr:hypothetical protein C8R43DRAFT_1141536 [Mycena crocata]
MALPTEHQAALPPELERAIFEIAALLWPSSVPRLVLVSKRVRKWLEPLLYHTLTVGENGITAYPLYQATPLTTVMRHSQAGFRKHVRNLFLDLPHTDYILSVCTRVENLWLSSPLDDINLCRLVGSLRLSRFYGDVQPLLRTLPPNHQFFAHLTHLELMGSAGHVSTADLEIWSNISHLPRLTHLSFNDETFIDIAPALLQSCHSLALLIQLQEFGPRPDHWYSEDLIRDLRFVALSCRYFVKDWQVGVRTGWDYWARAEEFVKERQGGIIATSQFRMGYDASNTFR